MKPGIPHRIPQLTGVELRLCLPFGLRDWVSSADSIQLVSCRAPAHGSALHEALGEPAERGEGPWPGLELLNADVDVPRPPRHASLV